MSIPDFKIIKKDNLYYSVFNGSNIYIDEKFCIAFSNEQDALNFNETFILNYIFFIMYLKDDELALKKYIKENPQLDTIDNARGTILAPRKITFNTSKKIEINGNTFLLLKSTNDIKFKRGNKKIQFYPLNKAKKVLKAMIEARSKWQKGFDVTNAGWNREIVAYICYHLYHDELKSNLTEDELKSIKVFGGYYYAIINNLLCGEKNKVSAKYLNTELIDFIISITKSFRPAPFDLYLHRKTGSRHYLNDNSTQMIYKQFISTSLDYESIMPFSATDTHDIYIPQGTPVIFKGIIDGEQSSENEVILPPMKFTIKKIDKFQNGNIYLLTNGEFLSIGKLLLEGLENNKENYLETHTEQEYKELFVYAFNQITNLVVDDIRNENDLQKKKTKIQKLKEWLEYYKNIYKYALNAEENLNKYRF